MQVDESNLSPNGIGLENVKKRLEVLYPGNLHQLHVEKKAGYFHVLLHLTVTDSQ
jgi:LytS/YehU family sensor histidine kinase